MNDTQSLIGKILSGPHERDAIHVAVAPVRAAHDLLPGQHVNPNGACLTPLVGIVDPFLKGTVREGQTFWLFLYPNTVTGLRHDWAHPEFVNAARRDSEAWMRAWAVEHTPGNYYSDGDDTVDEEVAYAFAIRAGRENHIGPYEDARDHINDEWWSHWEAITGERGRRGEYFLCSC